MIEHMVLGGGPAGTAMAYYLNQAGFQFELYEKSSALGGNARTIRWGDHLYDTGAHRIHAQIESVTDLFLELLGEDVHQVSAPSQIVWRDEFIDFPLKPLDLLSKMPRSMIVSAMLDWFWSRHFNRTGHGFESQAVGVYGETIAREFLLNYTQKLWGRPCSVLHPRVAGKRLKGLGLKTFLFEFLKIEKKKNQHLDGSFYYPKWGIGSLFTKLQQQIPEESTHLNLGVKSIQWDSVNFQICEVRFEDDSIRECDSGTHFWNTLPLNIFVQALNPPAPSFVLNALEKVEFRHLGLFVVKLSKDCVSENASLYFSDTKIPFNRLYEPSNRSQAMSPDGETLAVLEVGLDSYPSEKERKQIWSDCLSSARNLGLWEAADELDYEFQFLANAYPIPMLDTESRLEKVDSWLSKFNNLYHVGRGAQFEYSHLHDHFAKAHHYVNLLPKSTK